MMAAMPWKIWNTPTMRSMVAAKTSPPRAHARAVLPCAMSLSPFLSGWFLTHPYHAFLRPTGTRECRFRSVSLAIVAERHGRADEPGPGVAQAVGRRGVD